MSTVLSPVTVEYPSSDGKPVAESDFQRDYLLYAVAVLQQCFRARQDVYVSGNLLLYYEVGNPAASVAPGRVRGAGSVQPPADLVPAVAGAEGAGLRAGGDVGSTRKEDQGTKRELYRRLGVREYWQYDPTGECLEPALQGRELRGGEYEELPATERGAGRLVLCSAVLGLELRLEAGEFRFHDAAVGITLGTREELEARLREETAARQREAAARRAAEARVAELERRLREQRSGPSHDQALPAQAR